jgi:O-glycosyl hydrolase
VVESNDLISPARVTPTVDFTALARASKFVAPGAYRIESNTFEQGNLEDVVFRNPDGSIVCWC